MYICEKRPLYSLGKKNILTTKNPVQADAYLELIEPHRVEILKSSVGLAQELLSEYNGVTYEELAVEIAVGASFP